MAMNFFNNNRTIFWILIFMVLINITAFATYFIYIRKPASELMPASGFKNGIALKQELSLTPDQSIKVNEINAIYKDSSEPIVEAIKQNKADLIQELSKDNTDTILVAKLANDMVTEQKKLQMANIKQFLDLKKVCTPEQTQKLSQIYSELYGCENKGQGKGWGKGQGRGYRHRYGQQKDTLKQ
jgi:Spy/CpxP family protein refolding chaperone